jgi:hypothetical protein
MSGMNLGFGGGVKIGSSLGGPSATIAQTAYGAEQSPNSAVNGGMQSWHLMVGVPVIAVAFLGFLRWSLPK